MKYLSNNPEEIAAFDRFSDLMAKLIDSFSVKGIKNFSANNLELLEFNIPSSVIVSMGPALNLVNLTHNIVEPRLKFRPQLAQG